MNCSNCGQSLEAGAAFCGNCGQPILQPAPVLVEEQTVPEPHSSDTGDSKSIAAESKASESINQAVLSPIAQAYTNQTSGSAPQNAPFRHGLTAAVAPGVPSYAVPVSAQQSGEMKASMSLVVGVLGIVGAFFIPLVGLGLGIAGVVLATLSRRSIKHGISTAGLIISGLALLTGLASWVFVISHDPRFDHKIVGSAPATSTGPSVSAQSITTPCYSIDFGSTLNVQNNDGSCNMDAFNGVTLDDSTNAYKVYGTVSSVSVSSFANLAKQAIERDIAQSLPSFTINHEYSGQFAGSPAYFVTATNGENVSVMEAVALHVTSRGDNFFVFVHAVNSGTVDLKNLQTGWRWQ